MLRDEPAEVVVTAWLIAAFEVCGYNSTSIEHEGFSREVAKALFRLSIGNDSESLKHVKGNPIARRVAIANLMHFLGNSALGPYTTWETFKRTSDLHFLLMEPKDMALRDLRSHGTVRPDSFTATFPKAE